MIELNSDAEPAELDGGGVFLGREENTVGLKVAVNDAVLVAVGEGLEDLAHVVAGHCFAVHEPGGSPLDDFEADVCSFHAVFGTHERTNENKQSSLEVNEKEQRDAWANEPSFDYGYEDAGLWHLKRDRETIHKPTFPTHFVSVIITTCFLNCSPNHEIGIREDQSKCWRNVKNNKSNFLLSLLELTSVKKTKKYIV